MTEKNNAVPTIEDIAKIARVSPSTVSRVINHNSLVKESTRERVLQAIEELNFIPNSFARGLMNKKSHTIGLIIPTIQNLYFGELISGIEDVLYLHGYSVLLCGTGYDVSKQSAHLKNLLHQQVDGIIIVSHNNYDELLLQSASQKVYLISIQSRISDCDSITSEMKNGMFMATEHLLNLGHRKISYICFDRKTDRYKLEGFAEAFQKHNLPFKDEYILDFAGTDDQAEKSEPDVAYLLTKKLLESDDPPTAIQAMNDYYALGAYRAIMEKGLNIPQDISVCGFDNIGIAKLLNPPLTTVDQFAYEQGKVCGELMMQRISGNENPIHRKIVLPTSLVVRSSTAAPKAK